MGKNGRKSFSLVEVLVFTSILSIFFVMAAAVTVASMRNMQINQHKILGTRYAEELLDWLRSKKEDDWNTFMDKAPSAKTYCFNTLIDDVGSWSSGACGSSYSLDEMFNREAILEQYGSDKMKIRIVVRWREFGNTYEIPINTIFSQWE